MRVSESAHQSALTSLAILKVNHDQNRDYISNFVPFIAQVIREAPQDEISLSEVQKGVQNEFALKIPQGALNTILHRACKLGYVERGRGIYRRNAAKLSDLDLGSIRSRVKRQQLALLKELAEFASQGYPVDWGVSEAERALLAYLSTRGTAILTAAVNGSAIDAPAPVDNSGLIVNAFVSEAAESNPNAFEFLLTLVKGSMLADVLYLPGTFEGAHRKFGDTEFFLDTGFVLRAIGFSSREASEPARELLALLEKQNVRLRMFEHNRDEAMAVMDYGARALAPGSQLPLSRPSEFLRSDGWTASDVEDFIAKVPLKLSAFGIEVVAKPPYQRRLGIDEAGLEQNLKEELPEQRAEARRRDVDSLAAISRLRRGEASHDLESCGAVLVTTNGALVSVGSEFFRHQGARKVVSPVIHAHDLTWIAWLKLPTAAPDLPRLQVIADSFAALNPPEELWSKYTSQIARLRERGNVSDEDFHILRYSMEARRALQSQTLGDADVFTEGSVPAILAAARTEITAELRRELETERATSAQQAAHDQEVIAAERRARANEETRRTALEAQIAEKERKREERITERAQALAAKLAWALFFAAATVLGIASFVASDVLLPRAVTSLVPVLVFLAILTVTLFSIINGIFGTNLDDLRKRLQRLLAARIANWLRRSSSA
jgi:VIT1/CCC1 family predicted Fe2+/Mn2+ transporter